PRALSSAAQRALPGLDEALLALASHYRFAPATPWKNLPDELRDVVLHGSGEETIPFPTGRSGRGMVRRPFEGLIPWLERRLRETRSSWIRDEIEGLIAEARCAACDGTRLRRETRFVRVGGRSIVDVSAMPIRDAVGYFDALALPPVEAEIGRPILK